MRTSISCQTTEGDLPILFQWRKAGEEVAGGREAGMLVRENDEYSSNIVFERLSSDHSANYTCTAVNNVGRDSFTTELRVNGNGTMGDPVYRSIMFS